MLQGSQSQAMISILPFLTMYVTLNSPSGSSIDHIISWSVSILTLHGRWSLMACHWSLGAWPGECQLLPLPLKLRSLCLLSSWDCSQENCRSQDGVGNNIISLLQRVMTCPLLPWVGAGGSPLLSSVCQFTQNVPCWLFLSPCSLLSDWTLETSLSPQLANFYSKFLFKILVLIWVW